MILRKLIRITTVPISLDKLLEGQLAFMKEHYEVTAVSSQEEELKRVASKQGVPYFFLPLTRKITPIQDLKAVYRLYKFLKKEKPEIVHTHTPKAGIVGMLAARLAGVPLRLHTVAGLPLLEATGVKRKILDVVEKLTYRCATKVYPNAQGLKTIIEALNFTKKTKLKVIGKGSSNGIDTTYFSPDYESSDMVDVAKKLHISQTDFTFILVGRLVGDKGVNELVKAFVTVQEKHPDTSLLLVGPLEEELDPLMLSTQETIKTHSKIYTTGYVDDVRPYFAFAKALTFPSYREGFPNVVLQAGAMGLPSIVSDINGCNEIIVNNHNGLIVPVKSSTALETAMCKLIEDKVLYDRAKANARSVITDSYERREIWQALLEEYRGLLNGLMAKKK
ncbi:glycosyltransferase family 4 protein [uncultured Dokdonia sp.]|uniref:glycosyltransferase family 4 protein n=1 Tax=uncultured Dokdonia sp. TaxID=575653 RepID=UPI0026338A2D|nr:glycosyltransferase family 4 protein [uncultured Dokdonia sp.]